MWAPRGGGSAGWMSIARGAHLGPLLTPICSWPSAARAGKACHPHLLSWTRGCCPGWGRLVFGARDSMAPGVRVGGACPLGAGHEAQQSGPHTARSPVPGLCGAGGSWPGSCERGSSLERQGWAPSWQGTSPLGPPRALSPPPTVRPQLRLTFPSTSPSALSRLRGPPAQVSPGPTTAAGPQTPPRGSSYPRRAPSALSQRPGPTWWTLNALLPDFHPRSALTASLCTLPPRNETGGHVHTASGTGPPGPGRTPWEPADRRVRRWAP